MPLPIAAIALGSLALKGLGGLFGRRAANKRNANQRSAQIAGLNIGQRQREDTRRGRLSLGNSVLGRVPGSTAGGRVNTGVSLDPEVVANLSRERTYDFASAVPDESAGSGSAFAAGLFNSAADTVPYLSSATRPTAGSSLGGITLEDLLNLGRTRRPQTGGAMAGGTSEE